MLTLWIIYISMCYTSGFQPGVRRTILWGVRGTMHGNHINQDLCMCDTRVLKKMYILFLILAVIGH